MDKNNQPLPAAAPGLTPCEDRPPFTGEISVSLPGGYRPMTEDEQRSNLSNLVDKGKSMSLDLERDYPDKNEPTVDDPKPERCNVKHCQDEGLWQCEACLHATCDRHAKHHAGMDLCLGCHVKELGAMAACCHSLGDVTDLMVKGTISASEAAERLMVIANELSEWDVKV